MGGTCSRWWTHSIAAGGEKWTHPRAQEAVKLRSSGAIVGHGEKGVEGERRKNQTAKEDALPTAGECVPRRGNGISSRLLYVEGIKEDKAMK